MKTYLFDTINRYKRFSEKLDVQTAICNKSWWVFNDSGEKELYIFNEDGTLDVSFGGRVTEGKWRYVSANKSIIVSANSESFMLDPAFIDNAIFALKLNGTDQYVFMIDENNTASFAPSTYKELMGYFDNKCNKVLALEQKKIREQEERELEERKSIELERVKIEKQELVKRQQRKKEMQEQKRLEQKAKLDLCEQQKWMREQLPRWVYKYRKMISVSDGETYLISSVNCMKPLLLYYLFFVLLSFVFWGILGGNVFCDWPFCFLWAAFAQVLYFPLLSALDSWGIRFVGCLDFFNLFCLDIYDWCELYFKRICNMDDYRWKDTWDKNWAKNFELYEKNVDLEDVKKMCLK